MANKRSYFEGLPRLKSDWGKVMGQKCDNLLKYINNTVLKPSFAPHSAPTLPHVKNCGAKLGQDTEIKAENPFEAAGQIAGQILFGFLRCPHSLSPYRGRDDGARSWGKEKGEIVYGT
ncbi:MAG: hypothetical protein AAFX90_10175 [Pseudomonadota bacterium]